MEGKGNMKDPAIEKYMIIHNLSLREFSRKCGVPSSVMCRFLQGKTDIRKSSIDKILIETRMSYETCFKEE